MTKQLNIKQNETTLTIENYQNKISNIPFFDVLDNLEMNGIIIRLNEYNGNVNFIYNRKVYPLNDGDISTLENCNVITLKAKGVN